MQLIHEIIELLSSSNPNLGNALFKAQVLAHKLDEGELKQWVANELNGYPDSLNLPSYRVLYLTVMGNFTNGYMRYSNQPLPIISLEKRLREKLEIAHLTQSIAVIEEWSKNDSDLTQVIQPEFYSRLSKGLAGGYEVERAWGKHSVGALLQVVVEVRSRLLDFALQLSDRIPSEPESNEIKQISKEKAVSEIFKNAIFGDNATIVVGDGRIQGITNSIVSNDFDSLAKTLRTHHVTDEDISGLRSAIDQDLSSDEHANHSFGPEVRHWIGGMVSKAGTSTWQIAMGTAGNVLGTAISAYYGFGGV